MSYIADDKSARDEAVKLRDKNILLSAAAGAGKTFTLTWRIAKRLIEDENPIKGDELLVVTFTQAAAGELKNRIIKNIEELAEKNPGKYDELAEEQKMRLNGAMIGTIDSFCGNVVKRNFTKVDGTGIEPNYSANPTEAKIILQDAINDVLEEYYKNRGSKEFPIIRELIDAYCNINSDDEFRKLLTSIIEYMDNLMDPDAWLQNMKDNVGNMDYWYDRACDEVIGLCDDTLDHINMLKDAIEKESLYGKHFEFKDKEKYFSGQYVNNKGETKTGAGLLKDIEAIRQIKESIESDRSKSSGKLFEVKKFESVAAFSANKNYSPEEKEAHSIYTGGRKAYSGKDGNFNTALAQIIEVSEDSSPDTRRAHFEAGVKKMSEYITVLIGIIEKIQESRLKKSKEKSIFDFSQIERFALNLLRNEDGTPSDIAKEYRKQFKEVYIDEYQDTNGVQEEILRLVSQVPNGGKNWYAVGDVKQSIYRFRNTTPKFFKEKYNNFKNSQDNDYLLNLTKNFRSSNEVLQATNVIFNEVMTAEVADIDYKKDNHSLIMGSEAFVANDDPNPMNKAEIIYVTDGSDKFKKKKEYYAVAERILEIINDDNFKLHELKDKEKKDENGKTVKEKVVVERKPTYKDFCILATKNAVLRETEDYLRELGFPVMSNGGECLFYTPEIMTAYAFLKIIDNPLRDAELYSVLTSQFFDFTPEEVARIKFYGKDRSSLYANVKRVALNENPPVYPKEDEVREKAKKFYNAFEKLREESIKTNVSVFCWTLVNFNGFYDKQHTQAQKNLRELVDLTIPYDSGKRGGLYAFITFTDRILKNEENSKSSSFPMHVDSNENAIKFMTVHKSKGLEFPIVILIDSNQGESGPPSPVYFDDELGFGISAIESFKDEKLIIQTEPMKLFKRKNVAEDRSEMQRTLYVALTRAKDKLIVTTKTPQSTTPDLISKLKRKNSKNYCNLLWLALNKPEAQKWWEIKQKADFTPKNDTETAEELYDKAWNDLHERIVNKVGNKNPESAETKLPETKEEDTTVQNRMQNIADDVFDGRLPSKLSVSAVKRLDFDEDGNAVLTPVTSGEIEKLSDTYETEASGGRAIAPAGMRFGTLMHKALELILRKITPSDDNIDTYIENCVQKWIADGIFTTTEAVSIDRNMLKRFLNSSRGQEVIAADEKRLEAPFTLNTDIAKYFPDKAGDEPQVVTIQGVIDLYYRSKKDNGIVLVDFKTDEYQRAKENKLLDSYKVQLRCYRDAIETISGEKVVGCYLYFLRDGKEETIKD